MEASGSSRALFLGEIVDLNVDKLPLDKEPPPDGDDSAAHAADDGVVDELQAIEEELAEQESLDPELEAELEAELDEEDEGEEGPSAGIKRIRRRVIRAAVLGVKHADQVHWTQGARRWDGIANRCRSHRGRFPLWADCSSYVTWCLWDAFGGANAGPDVVNGNNWKGGYTGTLKNHGRVVSLANAKPGDLVHYGPGTGAHVTIVIGKNKVVSHGSEGGPHVLRPDYRSDISQVRRYFG
jgi:CHAP domain